MTQVFAHRGASGYAPENTLEAFSQAMEQGADGIELDVQFTKDKKIVVLHDETIDRTSDHKGYVRDYTLEELKKMSFHNHMEKYRGIRIPSLKEVLDLVRPGKMKINIELKTGIFWYEGIEEAVTELVEREGFADRVIYSSFNHYSIQKIRELAPKAQTAWLFSDVILDIEKRAAENQIDALHPAVYHMKMADRMERYLNSGRKIRVWTVNKEKDLRLFMEKKVDAVITNYPDKATAIRKEIQDAERETIIPVGH